MTLLRGSAASAGQVGFGGVRHFVTDRRRFHMSTDDLVLRAANAVHAGVDVIQVREHDLPDRELVGLVREIVVVTSGSKTGVLVNDRADIAIAAGAAGVHLRGDSISASRVREISPEGFLIGRSVHSVEEVELAVAGGGCDYLLFGTVFPSEGKPAGHPVAGLEQLALACARSPLPVVAIGGITEARAEAVRHAGAAGFAAVGMFMCLTPFSQVV